MNFIYGAFLPVAAVYDRRCLGRCPVLGGRRPPLQPIFDDRRSPLQF